MEETEFDAITLFDLTPEQFAWRAPVPRQIEQRRAEMADMLIFDILLSAGGIKHPDSLYPPRDAPMLHNLLDAIEETTYDSLKKDCLIYFLLRWHKDGREDKFQQDRCIPPQFVALADAYWFLDSGEDVPRAISLLSDARLNRDYTSKILQAISLEKENANALVLQYIRSAKPLLTEPDDVDAYSIALAESSLFEAWQYQRTFPEDEDVRPRIFRNVIRWCLKPKPRAKALTQLLAFPLSNYEQSLLHDFALRPPPDLPVASIPVIQDLTCVRLIHSGKLTAAVKLDRQFAITPIRGTFGGKVSEQARRIAQERKQTMEEVMSVMSSAERQLLELELEQMSQSADTSTYLNGGAATDLNMSWEHVRLPTITISSPASSSKAPAARLSIQSDPQVLPIPERSGAPRFAGRVPRRASASSTFTAVRDMFDSISKPPAPAPVTQPQILSRTDTDPLISSIEAPSTGKLPSATDALSTAKNSDKQKEPVSLFDSVGSANKVPNAFFQPPTTSASAQRSLHEGSVLGPDPNIADISTASALDVSAMLHEPADTDVEMHQPVVEERSAHAEQTRQEDISAEFDVSLFGQGLSGRVNISTLHSRGKAHAAEPSIAPPGAFAQDSEDESDHEPISSAKTALDELDVPPPPAPRKIRPSTSTRRIRAPVLTKEPSVSHSVPGAFIADEEEDDVPPLPPATPAPRRPTRKTRSSKADEEPPRDAARPTRRSSRLSILSPSSRGSSSPEPISPEKRTRSTKTTRQPTTSASSRIPRGKKQR